MHYSSRPTSWTFFIALACCWLHAGVSSAELHCPEPTAEAGDVRSGTALSHRFLLTNTGSEAVEITGTRTSCGCLKAHLEQEHLAPGASTALVLEVNTLTQPAGAQSWPVQVAARSGGRDQQLTLELKGTVIYEVSVLPAALTMFSGEPISSLITVADARSKPFTVTAVRSSSPCLTTKIVDHVRDEAGRVTVKIRMSVADGVAEGRHDETVTVYTDDPEYRELKIPVNIVKRPSQPVRALPSLVSLTAVAGQPVPARIVLLSDRTDREVLVDGIDSDHPAVTATWAAGPENRSTLRVSVDRAKVTGVSLNANLAVRLRSPEAMTVTVPVTCTLP